MQISESSEKMVLAWAKARTYAGCTGQAVGVDYGIQQLLHSEAVARIDKEILIETRLDYFQSMAKLPRWRRVLIHWLSRGITWL